MSYRLVVTPEAEEHLGQIQDYIATKTFPENAARYASRVLDALERLATAPFQGTAREDIGPGMRTTGFERRATILYAVVGNVVVVVGIYHGGRELPKVRELSSGDLEV